MPAKTTEKMGNEEVTTFDHVTDAARRYACLQDDQTFDFDVLCKDGLWKTIGDIIHARKKPILAIYHAAWSPNRKWSNAAI